MLTYCENVNVYTSVECYDIFAWWCYKAETLVRCLLCLLMT